MLATATGGREAVICGQGCKVLTQYTLVTPTSPDDITIVTNVPIDPAWVYIWTGTIYTPIHQ